MRIVGRRGASSPDTPRAGTGARRLRGVVGRGAGRRWAGAGTASVVALPLVLMSLFGAGSPQAEVVASTGAAWVASPALGLVSLIDGPSQEVAAALAVPPADSRLTVEQAGSSAYVVDPGAGTVTRIDGAVQEATPPTPIGVPGGELTVLQGGGEVYVLDATRRTVTLIDPVTLERRREVPLGAAPGPGQAVVDDRGRLWVVDGDAGGLSRFDGSLHVEPDAAGAQDRLVLVDGRPVLVDAAAASIAPVSDSGGVGRPSCLRIGADDEVQLVGSPDGGLVLAAIAATGTLVTGTVGTDDCARVVRLVDPGTPVDFGPLVHRGDFVLVPNRATGETIVVDLREDTVAVRLPLTPPGNQLQLIGRGPLVFYNDLDGDTAGVLTFDGDSWVAGDPVRKYDPDTGEPASVTTPDAGGVTPGPGTSPGAGSGAPPSGAPPSDTPEARLPDTPQARLPDLPGADPATPDPARAGSPPPGPGASPERRPGGAAGPGGGPGPSPSSPPTSTDQAVPVVVGLVPDVEPVPAGSTLTVTADVRNAQGATWTWTVAGAADWTGTEGRVQIEVPADASGTIDVGLVVRTTAGEASGSRAVGVLPATVAAVTCTPAEAGLGQPVTCRGSATGATDPTWRWVTTGPDGEQSHELEAGQPLEWTPGTTTPGSYGVTLAVGAGAVPEDFAGSVADLCTITGNSYEIDVRSRVQRGTVQPTFRGCWIEAHATPTYTELDWLDDVFTGVELYGDAEGNGHATIDFLRSGEAPRDGLHQGAVVMTLPNGRTAVYDVLGNRPPVVDAYPCEVVGADARFVLKADDGDIPSLTVTMRIGFSSAPVVMQSFTTPGGTPGFFQAYVPLVDVPADATTWVGTVSDGYDEAGGGAGMGAC